MLCCLSSANFPNKCKKGVKCINSRIVIIRKKKQAMLRCLRKDVADLLANGHDTKAFGRIEAVIVEMNLASCYDMIEQYCECILKQLPSLQKQRECSEEAKKAMSTLIFAAARFPDLPELCDLRHVFTERYRSQMKSSINGEFVNNVQKKSFSMDKKLQAMQGIAEEFSVLWDSKAFQQKNSSRPAAPISDQPKRQSDNNDHLSPAENNWRNAAVEGRKEEVITAGGDLKAVSKEKGQNPPRSLVQKEQVQPQPQPRDISCRASAPVSDLPERGNENIDHLSHANNNRRNDAVRVRKEAVTNAGGDLEVPSKERWKPPPKTPVQKEQVQPEPGDIHVIPSSSNGRRHDPAEKNRKKVHAAEGPENVETYFSDAKVLPSVNSIGSHNETHYINPSFKTPSTASDDVKLTSMSVNSSSPVGNDMPNGDERPKSFSVRTKHPKPPLVENKNVVNDVKPTIQTSSSRRKEGRQIGDYNGEEKVMHRQERQHFNVEEKAMSQHVRQASAEELGSAVGHDQQASQTQSGHRKHGSRQRAATYSFGCDEEEEVLDRLLFHYSQKGIDNESSKTRTRMRAPTELVLDADRAGVCHRSQHNGNGRVYPGLGEPVHCQITSLPSEPTTPIPEVGAGKGPAPATSLQPEMVSPNRGLLHPRLPDGYDEFAARLNALRKT